MRSSDSARRTSGVGSAPPTSRRPPTSRACPRQLIIGIAQALGDQRSIPAVAAPAALLELGPFDGVAPEGPDEIFSDGQITDLIARIRRFDETADPSDQQATA